MSYYFSTFAYSSSISNGKQKESAKGYSKSSNGPEQFFVYDKENKNVTKNLKGERKKEHEKFKVIDNNKKIEKEEQEVYNILMQSNPKINPEYILDFLNSNEFKLLKYNNSKPSSGNSKPSSGNSKPSSGNSKPSSGKGKPSSGNKKPSSSKMKESIPKKIQRGG